MKDFAALYAALDASTSTNDKVAALTRYFARANQEDAAWATYFLAGGKPRQVVNTRVLREIAQRAADVPGWLFEESYQAVGDLAETIAHVLPPPLEDAQDIGLAQWITQRLAPLRGAAPAQIEDALTRYWRELDWHGKFLLTKLIGGGFRVGVSKLLVQRALAQFSGIDAKLIAQRMMGMTDDAFTPTAQRFAALIAPAGASATQDIGSPYPFFLAHALNDPVEKFDTLLGAPDQWLVEWKFDGIRAQVVKRGGHVWIWSRGEELITERFPEIAAIGRMLPDGCVLDGEIVVWLGGKPAPFALLQQRIGRKTLTKKVLADAPAALIAYDLLEHQGIDIRAQPQSTRRNLLESMYQTCQFAHDSSAQYMNFHLSTKVDERSWHDYFALREQSRSRGVEGFMLKRTDAQYGVGRTKASGTWLKWKIDPYSVDCVLVYAQRGHGRRASLYTDYTFAVWDKPQGEADRKLVTFAKAYSGLTDDEFKQVDAIINKTTIEKFGPIRSVTPTLVFELGFEGIANSPRHKSGIAVRFPRMLRWRVDKPVEEADTLQTLQALL
jgi:DNA ligase 1